MPNLLCIDYGQKNLGIAIATTRLAEPFAVEANSSHVFRKIKTICRTNQIDLIIIGLPQGKLVPIIKSFASQLNHLGLKTTFYDESFSSLKAASKLAHKTPLHRSHPQDAYQAAVILQDYLDSH